MTADAAAPDKARNEWDMLRKLGNTSAEIVDAAYRLQPACSYISFRVAMLAKLP